MILKKRYIEYVRIENLRTPSNSRDHRMRRPCIQNEGPYLNGRESGP